MFYYLSIYNSIVCIKHFKCLGMPKSLRMAPALTICTKTPMLVVFTIAISLI